MVRMPRPACWILVLLVLPSLVGSAAAATVVVRANQRTAEGGTVAGDGAAVTVFYEGAPVTTRTGTVDASGAAVFRNVPTGPEMTARAEVRHQDLVFHGGTIALSANRTEFSITVDVFDVTRDRSGLSVGVHHLLVEPAAEHLQISEYMELRNDSDKAITSDQKGVGGRTQVVAVALPAGFQDLRMVQYFEPDAVVVTDTGFYDTMAVPPGSYQTVFTYRLPIRSETVQVAREFTLPAAEFVVFSRVDAEQIQGLGPAAGTVRLQDGRPAVYFNSLSPAAGDRLAFTVTDLAPPASGRLYAAVTVVVIGAAVFIAAILFRARMRRA